MKTIIVYATSHGTTESVAEQIKSKLQGDVDLANIKKQKKIDLDAYDQIIIGGSIHMGVIQKKIKKFCEQNTHILLQKKLGLFLSCMDDEKAQEQFDKAFSDELKAHATTYKLTGGEFKLEKMNFLERSIVKKVSGETESVNNLKPDRISELVKELETDN
ncbi:MAG: flavodoxin [Salinivirgaceae bacterium]|nr:MAG: flavodoxin [Salinivirgaceae bacterium]